MGRVPGHMTSAELAWLGNATGLSEHTADIKALGRACPDIKALGRACPDIKALGRACPDIKGLGRACRGPPNRKCRSAAGASKRPLDRRLDRRPHTPQSRPCHALCRPCSVPLITQGRQRPVCLRTHYCNREHSRTLPAASGVRSPSQRRARRQSARESPTLDQAAANQHPGKRHRRVGTRNTCSIHRDIGHLQQRSRPVLSALGGGGNRTRVLQYLTRASPGAACSAFLSLGDHASKTPTGSATVRCPA